MPREVYLKSAASVWLTCQRTRWHCASGMSFSQMTVWRRIEREVPQRQVEIALPQ